MGGILGGPPKPQAPDTSELDRQRAERDEEKAEEEAKNRAKIRNARSRRLGLAKFFTGSKQGVTADAGKQTLGGT